MAVGRPSTYNETIADSICEQIGLGRSIIQITNDPDFPAESTVYRWLESHPDFREKYARARELQAEHYASEIIELADNCRPGEVVITREDGKKEIRRSDNYERTKLQIEARKWIAMKLLPKKYGDLQRVEHSGELGIKTVLLQAPVRAANERPALAPEFGPLEIEGE